VLVDDQLAARAATFAEEFRDAVRALNMPARAWAAQHRLPDKMTGVADHQLTQRYWPIQRSITSWFFFFFFLGPWVAPYPVLAILIFEPPWPLVEVSNWLKKSQVTLHVKLNEKIQYRVVVRQRWEDEGHADALRAVAVCHCQGW
jgi:hypothetical protein